VKTILKRWPIFVIGAVLLAFQPGCATGGGYGEVYYEPVGYDNYVGWGPTYYVGPPRHGHEHDHDDHGRTARPESHPAPVQHAPPAYHPAPSSHSAPSIPTGHPRG